MIRTRRRLLAALLGPFLVAATLVALAGPAAAAVPLSAFAVSSDHPTSVAGQSVTLVATLTGTGTTPTGTVTFLDGATAVCSAVPLVAGVSPTALASCTTATLTVGLHSFTATYSGDVTYSPGTSQTFVQTVAPSTTTTTLGSSANPSVFSQPVTLTATVAPVAPGAGTPTGSVSFQDATVDITGCTAQALTAGVATCTLSTLALGTHSLTARYTGASGYATSLSSATSQAVNVATTAVALTSNHNPALAGQSATLVATVSTTAPGTITPTGAVAYFRIRDDMTRQWLGTVTLVGGVAQLDVASLPVGTNNLIAVYRGNAQLSVSSGQLNQTVNQSATATAVTTSRSSARAGRYIAFEATVTPTLPGAGAPTGTVAFFRMHADNSRTWIGNRPLQHGMARLRTNSIPLGTHPIVAVYRATPAYGTSLGTVSQSTTP